MADPATIVDVLAPWKERVHPLDVDKLRDLVYLLIDVSHGDLMTRDPIVELVETIMVCHARRVLA